MKPATTDVSRVRQPAGASHSINRNGAPFNAPPHCSSNQARRSTRASAHLSASRPLNAGQLRKTPAEVVETIDQLLDEFTDGRIADELNRRDLRSGEGFRFSRPMVQKIRRAYGLVSRYDRLRRAGLLTMDEVAARLGVHPSTVKAWRASGLLRGHAYNDKNECLYEVPGDDAPTKQQGRSLRSRRRFPEVAPETTDEVQNAT